MFDNKKQITNYFIPDDISNILLLVCRNVYDKNGNWQASGMKHKSVIEKLIHTVDETKFSNVINQFFNKKQNIYSKLKNKQYASITKLTKMLFLLRKTGLLRHNDLIKETRNLLTENNYSIDQEGLVTIKDKKEFLNKLYNKKMDDEEFSKNINSANSKCVISLLLIILIIRQICRY